MAPDPGGYTTALLVRQPLWDNHPVCGVSGYEAEAYALRGVSVCQRKQNGKKLLAGTLAGRRRTYPWGSGTRRPQCNHNNVGQTTPVEAHPAGQSAYGCYDMLGNVWEWTACVPGYEGFVSYPYAGYSKVYFDGQHRVLQGQPSLGAAPLVSQLVLAFITNPGGFRCKAKCRFVEDVVRKWICNTCTIANFRENGNEQSMETSSSGALCVLVLFYWLTVLEAICGLAIA